MTDLFWPGDHLAGDAMSDAAFSSAMITVEQAWLEGLVTVEIAPAAAAFTLDAGMDAELIARRADADGNPVSGLVALLRKCTPEPTSRWLHRGLTSQDVVDCALMLCLRDVLARLTGEVATQVGALATLIETHRRSPMVARTLTQAALPSTVGAKVAAWLSGLLDAADPLAAVRAGLPAQLGGAVGTLAGRRVGRLGRRRARPDRAACRSAGVGGRGTPPERP